MPPTATARMPPSPRSSTSSTASSRASRWPCSPPGGRRAPGLAPDGDADAGARTRPLVRHRRRVAQARRAGLRPATSTCAYYRDRTREWVSVSGTATVSRDHRSDPRSVPEGLEGLVRRRGRRARRWPRRSAARADPGGRRISDLHEGGQATADSPLRGRKGNGDRHAPQRGVERQVSGEEIKRVR